MSERGAKVRPVASGVSAVMAQKRPRLSSGQPWQDAELFPTPPWATRALCEDVMGLDWLNGNPAVSVWEPCAGLGHMSEVLAEYFPIVHATDLHIYDGPFGSMQGQVQRCDFLSEFDTGSAIAYHGRPDWIITNPPFGVASSMLQRAINLARFGVAFLLRLQWQETEGRYNQIFATPSRPTLMAQFTSRPGMCEGGYDPKLKTATAYAWYIWRLDHGRVLHVPPASLHDFVGPAVRESFTPAVFIPFDAEKRLTRPDDKKLARRCVHGFVPPSLLKRTGAAQQALEF